MCELSDILRATVDGCVKLRIFGRTGEMHNSQVRTSRMYAGHPFFNCLNVRLVKLRFFTVLYIEDCLVNFLFYVRYRAKNCHLDWERNFWEMIAYQWLVSYKNISQPMKFAKSRGEQYRACSDSTWEDLSRHLSTLSSHFQSQSILDEKRSFEQTAK